MTSSLSLYQPDAREDNLVEEDIDEVILNLLGLDDPIDIDYATYKSLLREKMMAGRVSGNNIPSEETELLTDEFKRVKRNTGRFKVKRKKVSFKSVNLGAKPNTNVDTNPQDKLLPQAIVEKPEDAEFSDPKETKDFLTNIVAPSLARIEAGLTNILNNLSSQQKAEAKAAEGQRKADFKDKKRGREADKEDGLGLLDKAKGIGKKVLSPLNDIFGAIWNFISNIFLGIIALKLLRFLKDPLSIFRDMGNFVIDFLNSFIKLIHGTLLLPLRLFLASLNLSIQTFESLINNTIGKIPGVPKLDLPQIPDIPVPQIPRIPEPKQKKEKEKPKEPSQKVPKMEGGGVVNNYYSFEGGGKVTTDTGERVTGAGPDTQLVALQPGEVVMSKDAVDAYGADTLLGMNAAAGGTNRPGMARVTSMSGGEEVMTMKGGGGFKLPPLPPTGTLGTGAQAYGASRAGGTRRHAGVDFDAPPDGSFYSRIGGEVIYAANAGGGYGNVVDVYNKDLGVTERIAEGDKNHVSAGQNIKPGKLVQTGTNQTGVFHYEIRKGKAGASGSFKGTMNPLTFLNSNQYKEYIKSGNVSQQSGQQADPNQPKREDFPQGRSGEVAYTKAVKEWKKSGNTFIPSQRSTQVQPQQSMAGRTGTPGTGSPKGYTSNLGPSAKAKRFLQELGVSDQDWKIYKDTLASIETSGYSLQDSYGASGGSGGLYDGRYQMGLLAKKDAARLLGINVPSRSQFRNNPQLQEDMILAHAYANHGYLTKGSKRYRQAKDGRERLTYLGFAHNQGWSPAASWLDSNMTKDPTRDGFGTSGTKFTKKLRRTLGTGPSVSQDSQQPSPSSQGKVPPTKEGRDSANMGERTRREAIDLKKWRPSISELTPGDGQMPTVSPKLDSSSNKRTAPRAPRSLRTGTSPVIPIPMKGPQPSTSGSVAGQKPVPLFSALDEGNPELLVVKSIYNIVG